MTGLFHLFLVKPLLNVLILLYNYIPGQDMGLAIIALTVLIRLVLYPSFQKSLRSQKALQQLQPKIDELKEKHKNDKEAQTKAILQLYQENKVNPLSSCLPLLVQLPILFALYRVFLAGLNGNIANELYPFVRDPGAVDTYFLGFVDLSQPNYIFAIVAGLLQFVQSKMVTPKSRPGADKTAAIMAAQFTYLMPAVTIFISLKLPAGLALYWATTTLFAILQQYYIMRKDKPKDAKI